MHNLLITTNLYCRREGKNYGNNQQINNNQNIRRNKRS